MSGIVCAIRGGPASQPTIQRAIALAQETGCPLHFLYIVNLDFLAQTIMHHKETMLHEMEQMGEFILLSVQEKARAQGVETVANVRHGKFLAELTALCHEIEADYVVVGRPRGEGSLMAGHDLEAVQGQIETSTSASVVWAGAADE